MFDVCSVVLLFVFDFVRCWLVARARCSMFVVILVVRVLLFTVCRLLFLFVCLFVRCVFVFFTVCCLLCCCLLCVACFVCSFVCLFGRCLFVASGLRLRLLFFTRTEDGQFDPEHASTTYAVINKSNANNTSDDPTHNKTTNTNKNDYPTTYQ